MFSIRMVNERNKFSNEVVSAGSLSCFKRRLAIFTIGGGWKLIVMFHTGTDTCRPDGFLQLPLFP